MDRAFVCETRRGYLRRYAIVLRLQDRGSPSVASPFGREKCHWHFSFIGLTPVGSVPASVACDGLGNKSAIHVSRAQPIPKASLSLGEFQRFKPGLVGQQ